MAIWIIIKFTVLAVIAAVSCFANSDVKTKAVVVVTDGVDPVTGICSGNQDESSQDSEGISHQDGQQLVKGFLYLLNAVTAESYNTSSFMVLVEVGCDDTTDLIIQNTRGIMDTRTVTGVITITRGHAARAIAAALRHLSIPMVEIVSGDVITSTSSGPYHYVVPHFTFWQLQNALFAASVYNWTAMTIADTDHNSETYFVKGNIFKRMVFDKGICSLPTFSRSDSPVVMLLPGSNASMATVYAESRTVLIVGDLGNVSTRTGITMNDSNQFILHLLPVNSDWSRLAEAIKNTCNYSTFINNQTFSKNHNAYRSLCLYVSGLNFGMKSYIQSLFKSLSFLIGISEISFDEHSCDILDVSLDCLLLENNETILDANSKFLYTMSKVFQIQYLNNNNSSLSNEYISKFEGRYTLHVPSYMPSAILNKDCGNGCDKCMQCFASTFSNSKLTTVGHGEAYIVGFFPIHQSSKKGFCKEPNPGGYFAATAFIEAVKSHFSLSKMFRISGVVFDSCSSSKEVICTIHSLETCAVSFKEEINNVQIPRSFENSSILGYVNGGNNFDLSTDISNKVVLSLHNWGYSTGTDLHQTFIDNILKALLKIGWTVINIIITEQEPFLTLAKLAKSSRFANSFCFVHEIAIQYVDTHDIDRIVKSMEKTPVYFLLTNQENTDGIFQHLRSIDNKITTKVSFVLTPLYRTTYQVSDVSTFGDYIIRFKPAGINVSQSSLDSINNTQHLPQNAWSQEFSNIFSSSSSSLADVALALQGTEELLTLLENNYIFGLEGTLRSTGLDMTAVAVRDNHEKLIAFVDKELTQLIEPFEGPSYNICRGWCPVCHACHVKETPLKTSFYLDGDIQIAGVFPLHKEGGSAFSCGAVQDDISKLIKIQSFMFAVESFQTRYPGLLPGLKVGGLVLDSCSSSVTSLKTIVDFQTCSSNFAGGRVGKYEDTHTNYGSSEEYNKFSNPIKNFAYIIDVGDNNTDYIKRGLEISRLENVVFVNGFSSLSAVATTRGEEASFSDITVQTLTALGWNKFIIISERLPELEREVKILLNEAQKSNICAIAVMSFNTMDLLNTSTHLEQFRGMPVVLMSSNEAAKVMFDSLKTIRNSYFWIIPAAHEPWRDLASFEDYFPLGSIFIDLNVQQNNLFNSFLHSLSSDPSFSLSLSPWFKDFWRLRFSCYFPADNIRDTDAKIECPFTSPVSDIQMRSPAVYNIIKSVDAVLHSVHSEYTTKCPLMTGICDQFAEDITNRRMPITPGARIYFQGEQLDNISDGHSVSLLSVFNFQKDGVLQVGSYSKPNLSLNITKIRLYNVQGLELNQIPRMVCATDCPCLDNSLGNDTLLEDIIADLYTTTHADFICELWAIIVLAIGCLGALLSLMFAAYVVYKVSRRALGKRYVGLGMTLLLSLILLFLTVLPFVFSQSETICGLRYLLPGLSYTFCFAVILVKLMSLQSYKMIGLGGEISGVNQFLTVFFIVGVQVAIGVQRWLFNEPNVHSLPDSSGVERYACTFSREDFASYNVYVMLLIVICCFYSIGVRKEKKNMGEAKLLLACALTCLAIWLIWLPCFFLLDRKWSDVIICAAILACATATLVTIFVPKIRMVSRLKYDVTQKSNFRNGHSVDTDFLYERPYSLPGTLTSTFSSGKMNYPKTFSHFDTDVNY